MCYFVNIYGISVYDCGARGYKCGSKGANTKSVWVNFPNYENPTYIDT